MSSSVFVTLPVGGSVVPVAIQPDDSAKGPFRIYADDTLFNGVYDSNLSIGYNVAGGGGRAVASEPAFWWSIEQDYYTGTKRTIESYWAYAPSDGGPQRRPIFVTVDRATHSIGMNLSVSNGVAFTDASTDLDYANLNRSHFVLKGYASQPSNTTFVLQAQNGKFASIQLAGGLLIEPVVNNQWAMRVGGTAVLEMSTTSVSVSGGSQVFGGTLSVQVPQSRKDVDASVFVKARAGQTTSLLRIVNSGNAPLVTVNPSGVLSAEGFKVGSGAGASGSFVSQDNKTVTVTGGIITSIA